MHIRVVSILGRFIEHSRVWYAANAGEPEYYIGSADWMPRNFDHRVECVVPVEDPELQKRLAALLDTCLADNRQAWELSADGGYAQRAPFDAAECATHKVLLKDSWGLARRPSMETTPVFTP